jgi:putative PIN family toxin of toxin-antitoxin system
MRVVVDTNIFVSAALKENSLPAIALQLTLKHGTLLKSAPTERQIFDVIERPYFDRLLSKSTRDWLREPFAAAELVAITEQIAACRDHTDDKFLELAVNGKADLVLSGDKDLLVLNPFRSIPIIAPSVFVRAWMR